MSAVRRPARKPSLVARTPRELARLYVALLDRFDGRVDRLSPIPLSILRSNARAVLRDPAPEPACAFADPHRDLAACELDAACDGTVCAERRRGILAALYHAPAIPEAG
jgi:hypothetical protein